MRRERRRTEKADGTSLDDAIALWGRLREGDRTKLFAAMLSAMMSKPASADELMFWLAVLREKEVRLFSELGSLSAGDEQ
jgi:hypothetical protein